MTNFDPTTPRIDDGTFTEKNQSAYEIADLTFDMPVRIVEMDDRLAEAAEQLAALRSAPRTYTANGFVQTYLDGQERVTRISEEEALARWAAREPITYDQVRTAKTSGATFAREGSGDDGIDLDTFFRKHADYNSRARAGQPEIYWYRPLKSAKPVRAEIVRPDQAATVTPAPAKESAAVRKINEAIAGMKMEDRIGQFESWASDFAATVINTETLKIVKRFRGESAWSDANRLAGDLHETARRAEFDSWND